MTILILYATTEGQTHKIARRAAAHLTLRGKAAQVLHVGDAADVDLAAFDGLILAASVHAGSYQPEFTEFVTREKARLDGIRHVFLSVSLSAASTEDEDREGIAAVVAHMTRDTGWTPQAVWHVAGAFRFTKYDFLKAWAMRWIAARRDPGAPRSADTEYTDWQQLYDDLDAWIA